MARYGYSGPGDSASFTMDATNAVTEATLGLLGGVMVTKRASGDAWSYPNIHGDVAVVADATGAKVGATHTYDPDGNALGSLPDNAAGAFDYGWLGSKQRGLEHEAAIATIEMGARQYVPALGRFLQVDPVEGGCANDYAYVDGDPINTFDLDGRLESCSNYTKRGNVGSISIQKSPEGALAWGATMYDQADNYGTWFWEVTVTKPGKRPRRQGTNLGNPLKWVYNPHSSISAKDLVPGSIVDIYVLHSYGPAQTRTAYGHLTCVYD